MSDINFGGEYISGIQAAKEIKKLIMKEVGEMKTKIICISADPKDNNNLNDDPENPFCRFLEKPISYLVFKDFVESLKNT